MSTSSLFDFVGEIGSSFDDSSLFPSRLQRYEVAHKRALQMAGFISSLNASSCVQDTLFLVSLLKGCGSYLVFRDYYTVGKIRLHAASFCRKHLLCPLCSIRRGAKALKAYTDKLSVILADDPFLRPYLVTFTIRNGSDLGERFDHFTKSMKKYQGKRRESMKVKKHGRLCSPVEMNKARGGVSSIEIKRGEGSGLWHVHSHAVWLCEVAPDPAELAQEWQEVTGDSFVVDVRPFSGNGPDCYLKGFMEVFKYAVKFSSMELSDNWEAFQLLSGRRLVDSFGVFRGVEVPKELTDELLDDLPYIEMMYQYFNGSGYNFIKSEVA